MKKFKVFYFLAGIVMGVVLVFSVYGFMHRHDGDVHVTVVSKEAETFVNESTGAVISTGLKVVIETDDGQEYYRIAENTSENNFDVYKEGNDFWIPKEIIQEHWN